MTGVSTPMFPLGLVHFPHVYLPLQVFEPRYRQLTIDCLDGTREFGVVLIERGSEVGGGDVRCDMATMTTIVEAGFDDLGLIRLDTVGVRRVRVLHWLDDDPYPRAVTEDLPPPDMGPDELEALDIAGRKVRHALALRAELGEPTMPCDTELDADPARALFQLAAIAPLGPADHQRLLGTSAPVELLRRLAGFMDDEIMVLESRLAGG
ncbi:MAG: LON peptidase substrate-binding domain-containing protein [Acidimicrobiales bacterium]